MTREYRYLGPDGEGIAGLPDGVGAALGSEYCVHLLPTAARMAEAVAEAARTRAPLLLLTPYFRDAERKAAIPLFRAIPSGANVDVAINDWGALQTLRGMFPGMRPSIGRLLSGQKRCPRIGSSSRLTEEGRRWHGEGIFSSPRARAYLAAEYRVTGYHVDDLPWSRPAPGGGDLEADAPTLYVHLPYAIVTVSDACPWIGGVSSASVASCPRPCRGRHVALREPSMGACLLQRGKARFVPSAMEGRPAGDAAGNCGIVIYGDPP
jgi:hypothetical protein